MKLMFAVSAALGECAQAIYMAYYAKSQGDSICFVTKQTKIFDHVTSQGFDVFLASDTETTKKMVEDIDPDVLFLANSKSTYKGKYSLLLERPNSKALVSCLDSNWIFLDDKRLLASKPHYEVAPFIDRIYVVFPKSIFDANIAENGGHYRISDDYLGRIYTPGFIPSGINVSAEEKTALRKSLAVRDDQKLVFVYFGFYQRQIVPRFAAPFRTAINKINNCDDTVVAVTRHDLGFDAPWLRKIGYVKTDRHFETLVAASDLVVKHHGMATLCQCVRHHVPMLCLVPSPQEPIPYYKHSKHFEIIPFEKLGLCRSFPYAGSARMLQSNIESLIFDDVTVQRMVTAQRKHFSRGEPRCYRDMIKCLKKNARR